nr:MAG TPA: hypothetical protein [Caudoviricetes sp.]
MLVVAQYLCLCKVYYISKQKKLKRYMTDYMHYLLVHSLMSPL